jgi:hypothetical protein
VKPAGVVVVASQFPAHGSAPVDELLKATAVASLPAEDDERLIADQDVAKLASRVAAIVDGKNYAAVHIPNRFSAPSHVSPPAQPQTAASPSLARFLHSAGDQQLCSTTCPKPAAAINAAQPFGMVTFAVNSGRARVVLWQPHLCRRLVNQHHVRRKGRGTKQTGGIRMKNILIGSCVALACAVSLGAQTPTGTSKPQSPPATKDQPAQKSTQTDDKTAVLRGCLRAGDQAGTYVLSNASATSGATLKNETVQLAGSPAGMNLKEHVGHTVEVTGILAAGDSRGAGPGAGAGTGTSKPGAAGAGTGTSKPGAAGTGTATGKPGGSSTAGVGSGAKLTVKSMKHVKEGC